MTPAVGDQSVTECRTLRLAGWLLVGGLLLYVFMGVMMAAMGMFGTMAKHGGGH